MEAIRESRPASDHSEAMRPACPHRIGAGEAGVELIPDPCHVAVEGALSIEIGGVGNYTIMCTPRDEQALAVGFMFAEGIIESMDDIDSIRNCPGDTNSVRVQLAGRPRGTGSGRELVLVTSCGLCGSKALDEMLARLPIAGDSFRLPASKVRRVAISMREQQEVFPQTGGTHAAGVFDREGEILSFAEDVGRHVALDKAIGKRLLERQPLAGLGGVVSGRVSLEMLIKCARARMELVVAVSAPTTLALEAAQRCNITVCAYVRDDRATVFTHPHRIV